MSRKRDEKFVTAKDCWYVCGEGALVYAILLSLATQDADRANRLRFIFRELFDKKRMDLGKAAQEWRNEIMDLASEAARYLASLLNPEKKIKEYDSVLAKFNVVPASEHYARSIDQMMARIYRLLEELEEKEGE